MSNTNTLQFDRSRWEGFAQTFSASHPSRRAAPERAASLRAVEKAAVEALDSFKQPAVSVARSDVKLINRVLKSAVQQRGAEQPSWYRLLQAVWRVLHLPDRLARLQGRANDLAQRSNTRWCAEDDRFLELMKIAVGETPLTSDGRAHLDNYLRKLDKRIKLLPECKKQKDSDIMVQLLRIRRGLGGRFSPDKLAELLDRAARLQAGGAAAENCKRFSVSEFGLLGKLGDAFLDLCKLQDAGMLPLEYAQSMKLLKQLRDFVQKASQEIKASSNLRPGDIEFDDIDLIYQGFAIQPELIDRMQFVLTGSNIGHSAIALGNARRAEMMRVGFYNGPADIQQIMSATRMYRLDWNRLVTAEGKVGLQALWKDQWPVLLQEEYENRLQEVAQTESLKKLEFDKNPASILFRSPWLLRPEKRDGLAIDLPTHCSEVSARILDTTLRRIEISLQNNSVHPIPRPFHSLFGKHVNFRAMTPGALARKLAPYAQALPALPTLGKYVNVNEPSRVQEFLLAAAAYRPSFTQRIFGSGVKKPAEPVPAPVPVLVTDVG